ncbi:MAG: DUF3836 domain-containing protein [Prevotella sp.]|nr:DUF3836 domain-containing protein [Prevotella sp.]
MKKVLFFAAMCLVSLTSSAQTITKEAVYQTYMNAVTSENSGYVYNADLEGNTVKTQYVYRKISQPTRGNKSIEVLKPHLKHLYTYDDQGRLATRTTLKWNERTNDWQNAYLLTYNYENGQNTVECSHWSILGQHFKAPTEKLVYEMIAGGTTGFVTNYTRKKASQEFKLSYAMLVPAELLYGDQLLGKNH